MTTSIPEENGTAQAMATGEQPKPIKKPRVAPRRAHVAPAKAKSAHKATKGKPGKRAPKGRQKAAPAREGSKTAHAEGTRESDRLAATFRSWVPQRDTRQEDGARVRV